MAATYVHLSGRNALFKLNGIKTEDEVNEEERPLKASQCDRCHEINSSPFFTIFTTSLSNSWINERMAASLDNHGPAIHTEYKPIWIGLGVKIRIVRDYIRQYFLL